MRGLWWVVGGVPGAGGEELSCAERVLGTVRASDGTAVAAAAACAGVGVGLGVLAPVASGTADGGSEAAGLDGVLEVWVEGVARDLDL